MKILWIDFETRSRCDLTSKGVYNYAQDGSTDVLCMSYAFDDDASFFGMSYSVTFSSNSSTAPLRRRVLTAYREALKTSDELSVARCEKTTEVRSLYEHYRSHALMVRSMMTRR